MAGGRWAADPDLVNKEKPRGDAGLFRFKVRLADSDTTPRAAQGGQGRAEITIATASVHIDGGQAQGAEFAWSWQVADSRHTPCGERRDRALSA